MKLTNSTINEINIFNEKLKHKTGHKTKNTNSHQIEKKHSSYDSSETEEDTNSNIMVLASDDSDTCASTYDDENQDEKLSITVDISLEKYYVVAYERKWYIGRILNILDGKCTVKFLKDNLDTYEWPRNNDIQEVKNPFVFYGPIILQGAGPFTIKRHERLSIEKKFKQLRKSWGL